jgi:hypothetical protein
MRQRKQLARKRLIPNSGLPGRYNVSRECIWRWKQNPNVNFPKPAARINSIDYFDEDELDEFDASTVVGRTAVTA